MSRAVTAREGAYLVLRQVQAEGAYANIRLKHFLDEHRLSPEDSRLATELVYGVSRMYLALDHVLSQLLSKPLDQLMPEAHTILRLSLYQLLYLPRIQPYAVVDEGVKLAHRYTNPALSRLVNGVLRTYLRQQDKKWLPDKDNMADYLHFTLSYPRWLVDYLLKRFGEEKAEAFCQAGNTHSGIYLRTNTLKTGREQLLQLLSEEGLEAQASPYAPETVLLSGGAVGNSSCLKQGLCQVQGMASQLVAHALSPKPGSRVLDMAAAPGGKTTHLAALMENQGELHAFDLHPHKIPLIEASCRRLGVDIVRAKAGDSALLGESYREWADYVLLDAPCSGLGVLSERADSRHHKQPHQVQELAKLSYRLLTAAADYVKPGGWLCYSTCTITKQENDNNVERFLAAHKEFKPAPMEKVAALLEQPEQQQAAREGRIQLMPFDWGTEGFFISLMKKEY